MPFSELPLDIVLEITGDLDLADSLHLVSVGISYFTQQFVDMHDIQAHAALPLLLDPVPQTDGTGSQTSPTMLPWYRHLVFASHNSSTLAIHAYKLRKNWASDSPSPISVHSFQIPDEPIAMLPIEGTPMIIIISPDRLACWDTVLRRLRFSTENAEMETNLFTLSAPRQVLCWDRRSEVTAPSRTVP